MPRLKITLVRGLVGTTQEQRATVRSLGLRKIRQSVVREDTPDVRGMVRRVLHLINVERSGGSSSEAIAPGETKEQS